MVSLLSFLPPATKLGQGNIFTPVCHSVHRGGMRGCSQGGMRGCSQGGWGGMCDCSRGGGEACVVARGGMCGCWGGCMVALGGPAWLLQGVCVAPGGHVWLLPGACMVAPWGVCMVAPGGHVWLLGGHVWLLQGGMRGCSGGGGRAWDTTRYGDMVNERAVRILLECILVFFKFCVKMSTKIKSRNGSSVVCTFLQRSGCSTMR